MSEELLAKELKAEKEPGRFVLRRWKAFLWIGLGVLGLTFVPVVGVVPLILIFFTAELFVFIGVPVGFIVWAFLVGIYYARAQGKGFAGYALKSAVVVMVSTGAIAMMLPFATGGGQVTFTAGFWCRMKTFADVVEIREWAQKVELKADESTGFVGEAPYCVKTLRPQHVTVDSKTRAATLAWGSGLWHWGLWVGPKGSEKQQWSFALKLEDGAYVWSQE